MTGVQTCALPICFFFGLPLVLFSFNIVIVTKVLMMAGSIGMTRTTAMRMIRVERCRVVHMVETQKSNTVVDRMVQHLALFISPLRVTSTFSWDRRHPTVKR